MPWAWALIDEVDQFFGVVMLFWGDDHDRNLLELYF
jgi:hypothetical protein